MKENKEKEVDKKSLGYRMGELLGATLIFAAMVIVAALTAKFVMWIF